MALPDQLPWNGQGPNVNFSHPLIRQDLSIYVNPDQITWAYGLNTAAYPTYGGEVVQVLSVYFDDMTIGGTVATYRELELIYSWFITYMQYATQGRNHPTYDQRPVTFSYYTRDWQFQIWPISLPSFRYGRDVVAPTWSLTAAVKEPDTNFADELLSVATFDAQKNAGATFGKVTADFGPTSDLVTNPFASPDADPGVKGQSVAQWATQEAHHYGDTFVGFLNAYNSSNLGQLPEFPSNLSQPPNLSVKSQKTAPKKKKK